MAQKKDDPKKTSAKTKTTGAKKPPAKKTSGAATKESAATATAARKRAPEPASERPAAGPPATQAQLDALPAETPHRREVLDQIVQIARGLEDDGLELLLEQAKVVEYKGKIEKFNRRLNIAAREAIEARREAGRPDYHVHIERTQDDFFVIQLDDERVFFNRGEMREMTRICHKAKDELAGARNLFRWLERERSDLLADAGIQSSRSPYLRNLYEVIVNTYTVKE